MAVLNDIARGAGCWRRRLRSARAGVARRCRPRQPAEDAGQMTLIGKTCGLSRDRRRRAAPEEQRGAFDPNLDEIRVGREARERLNVRINW